MDICGNLEFYIKWKRLFIGFAFNLGNELSTAYITLSLLFCWTCSVTFNKGGYIVIKSAWFMMSRYMDDWILYTIVILEGEQLYQWLLSEVHWYVYIYLDCRELNLCTWLPKSWKWCTIDLFKSTSYFWIIFYVCNWVLSGYKHLTLLLLNIVRRNLTISTEELNN